MGHLRNEDDGYLGVLPNDPESVSINSPVSQPKTQPKISLFLGNRLGNMNIKQAFQVFFGNTKLENSRILSEPDSSPARQIQLEGPDEYQEIIITRLSVNAEDAEFVIKNK